MKDRFSKASQNYATFRPTYPTELYDFLLSQTKGRAKAWDVGTGNGQVATVLAEHFQQVEATDISANQLANATQKPNILYSKQRAEETNFPNKTFDLITVAQAIHWFDFEQFYTEVRRTAKPNALLVVIGYGVFAVNPKIDAITIGHLYNEVIHNDWDKERHYIDENYATIPFPFEEIECPKLEMVCEWNFDQLMGYLNTWSGLQNYTARTGTNPLEVLATDLRQAWGNATHHTVRFPILLRIGKIYS
jgi:SAM-dependent methyltransferase